MLPKWLNLNGGNSQQRPKPNDYHPEPRPQLQLLDTSAKEWKKSHLCNKPPCTALLYLSAHGQLNCFQTYGRPNSDLRKIRIHHGITALISSVFQVSAWIFRGVRHSNMKQIALLNGHAKSFFSRCMELWNSPWRAWTSVVTLPLWLVYLFEGFGYRPEILWGTMKQITI